MSQVGTALAMCSKAIRRRLTSESMFGAVEMDLMRKRHKHGDGQLQRLFAHGRAFAESYDDVSFTPPYLGRITADALIVFGDRDPFYPVSLDFELKMAIPRSSLWVFPNGGHSPVFGEAAPPFADTALSFWAAAGGPAPSGRVVAPDPVHAGTRPCSPRRGCQRLTGVDPAFS